MSAILNDIGMMMDNNKESKPICQDNSNESFEDAYSYKLYKDSSHDKESR